MVKGNNESLMGSKLETLQQWRLAQNTNKINLLKEFQECGDRKVYTTVELSCSQYGKAFIAYSLSCKVLLNSTWISLSKISFLLLVRWMSYKNVILLMKLFFLGFLTKIY